MLRTLGKVIKTLFYILLYLLLLFLVCPVFFEQGASRQVPLSAYQLALTAFVVVFPPFWLAWKLFKRIRGGAALVLPASPYVLFLRPFRTDAAIFPEFITKVNHYLVAGQLRGGKTLEVALANAFKTLGVFVAIGRPGDFLAPDGATRIYVDHPSWQETVRKLLAMARAVILVSGSTQGVIWEKEHIRRIVDPRCLLLFVPRTTAEATKEMISLATKHLQAVIPPPLPSGPSSHGPFFYTFDSAWRASLLARVDKKSGARFFGMEILPQVIDFDRTLAPFISGLPDGGSSGSVSIPPPLPTLQ